MTPTPTPPRLSAWLEQAWLLRYLDRQLDGDETKWFEAYLLDKPDMLASIEADLDLRDALAAEAARATDRSATGTAGLASASAPAANDAQPTGAQPTGLDISDSLRRSAQAQRGRPAAWLGLAAALLVGLGSGWLASGVRAPASGPTIVASPTRIIYDTMRGEATPPRVEHADSRSPYVLVEAAVPPGARNITLKMADAPEQALTPSPDGFVSFLTERKNIDIKAPASITFIQPGKSNSTTLQLAPID